jgi:serine protease Do
MAKLKPVFLPLVLVSLLIAIGWGIHYNTTKDDDILTKYMVNTFMVSTEPIREDDRLPAKLGLVGHGTGFTYKVEEDGSAIIVTNEHVIEKHLLRPDITKISLYMINRPWPYEAEVIGADKTLDIAVLRIKPHDGETWAELAWNLDKNNLEGTPVTTLGHGLSQPYTLTKGIISGTDRWTAKPLNFLMQHSAIINVGNSGGPVWNDKGEVVAVNSMIISPSSNRSGIAAWDGVAFAIPAWQAKYGVDSILNYGYVKFSRIDFETYTPTIEQVQKQDTECNDGDKKKRSYAYVKVPGDAKHSQMMGLKNEDIIIDIDGEEVWGIASIAKAIINKKPSSVVLIKALRECKLVEIDYQLLELELVKKVPLR